MALLCAAAICLGACGDGVAPATSPDGSDAAVDALGDGAGADTTPPPACRPNNDRVLEAFELAPALGVPVTLAVSRDAASGVAVDVAGAVDANGARTWDWREARDSDVLVRLAAEPLAGKWYEAEFASAGEAAFVVDFDVDGTTESVLRHGPAALELLGVVSSEAEPAGGRTLLVYEAPVEVYRFPLRDGDEWVAVGTVRDGLVQGLPYAGRDTYVTRVDGVGVLDLEYLGFDHAMRVRTHVTLQPSVGAATSRRQVSFLSECFGEVARATSLPGEVEEDFARASELRRLSLE